MTGDAPLAGKVAIVTGVSSGFGWDVAHGFAVRGAHVVGVARREERGKLLEDELRSADLLFDFVAGRRQCSGQPASEGVVIVGDENATHSSSSFSLVVR